MAMLDFYDPRWGDDPREGDDGRPDIGRATAPAAIPVSSGLSIRAMSSMNGSTCRVATPGRASTFAMAITPFAGQRAARLPLLGRFGSCRLATFAITTAVLPTRAGAICGTCASPGSCGPLTSRAIASRSSLSGDHCPHLKVTSPWAAAAAVSHSSGEPPAIWPRRLRDLPHVPFGPHEGSQQLRNRNAPRRTEIERERRAIRVRSVNVECVALRLVSRGDGDQHLHWPPELCDLAHGALEGDEHRGKMLASVPDVESSVPLPIEVLVP
jgi:hypothetical protein